MDLNLNKPITEFVKPLSRPAAGYHNATNAFLKLYDAKREHLLHDTPVEHDLQT